MNYFWPGSVNTHWGPGPVNINSGPGPLNTNWGPGPVNTSLGPRPGAGGQSQGHGLSKGPEAGKYKYPLKLAYNRNKLFKTLHYWSRDMLHFDFLDKGLGIVSPAHFEYDFSTEMFFMLYSINWPNFSAWLSLLLEILGNICIAIVY